MINIRKICILLLLLGTFLNASTAEFYESLGYTTTYKETLHKAIKVNKPMMLVIYEKTCPYCRKLEDETLKSKDINKFVQDNFVAVGLEKNDDLYPYYLKPDVAPTVKFINPKDGSIIFISYGYLPKEEFIIILTEVNKVYLKYMK